MGIKIRIKIASLQRLQRTKFEVYFIIQYNWLVSVIFKTGSLFCFGCPVQPASCVVPDAAKNQIFHEHLLLYKVSFCLEEIGAVFINFYFKNPSSWAAAMAVRLLLPLRHVKISSASLVGCSAPPYARLMSSADSLSAFFRTPTEIVTFLF